MKKEERNTPMAETTRLALLGLICGGHFGGSGGCLVIVVVRGHHSPPPITPASPNSPRYIPPHRRPNRPTVV